jgi:demethylmenaquinone methyltransferase/2-methoxy-6-polyprenyl-1,4-benzoquinol methylase
MLGHAARRGMSETLVADALDLPFGDGEFDVVTVGFGLRNMASWEGGLREMGRVLRAGGHLLVLDFSLPENLLRGPYRVYLNKVLPRIAGWLTGQRDAYEYLAGTIERFPSGAAMVEFIEKHGFEDGQWTPLSGGIASIYTAVRSGDGG